MKKVFLLSTLFLSSLTVFCQNADSLATVKQVDSLIQVSRALTGKGDFDKALEINAAAETISLEKFGRESAPYGSACFNHGRVLHFGGAFPEAEKWYLESKAIREKVLGKEHPDYALSLNNLAILYWRMGNYEKAEPLYVEALAIREKVLGKEHPDYANSLNNLAVLYSEMGNYEKAEPLYVEALAIREKTLGKEHPDYANSLNNLAVLYSEMGNYEKAEPLYVEALAIREKVLGKEHPDYANSLNNLAILYSEMGNYEKAEPLYVEALAIREKTLGKEHPEYVSSLNNLAVLYWRMGKYEKAEPLHLEALAIGEKALGKEHPEYAGSLSSLAGLYQAMGNYEKAEPLHLEALAIREKALGKEHPEYAASLNNLASVYWDMGKYEKAEPLYVEAKAIWEKALGKEHPKYAASLNNLANVYWDMGKYEKAEPLYVEALAIREKSLGKEHSDYAKSLNNLANVYWDMGKYEKAEPLYVEALAIREKSLGKEHPEYAQSLHNLANLYSDMGNYEKAEPLHLEVLAIREKVLGKEHPDYAASLSNLANLYSDIGNYEKAEPLYVEAKAIWEKALGKEHPDYASSLHNLANLYSDMGNYEKAEPLYLEALAIWEKRLGKEHPEYASGLDNLALLYKDMGNYEKAEPLHLEALAIREKALGKEHPEYAGSLNSLAMLYWTVKKIDAAQSFLSGALKSDESLLLKASRHLSERELNSYTRNFADRGNELFSFAQTRAAECALCYDFALFHKGFLLGAISKVSKLALTDSVTADKYYDFKSCHRRLAAEYSKPIAERKNVIELEEKANVLEKELTRTVAGFGEALRQVNWQEVQAALRPEEAAIEFVRYKFVTPKPTDSVMYAALLLRPGWQSPAWVTLGEEKQLQSLFFVKENTLSNNIDQIYATRGIEPDSTQRSLEGLYPFIWQPLDSLLQGAKTVYFSPSGLLHYVNHGAVPVDSGHVLGDRYRLVQLGSTRQVVAGSGSGSSSSSEGKTATATATLFGGIRYDIDSIAISQANTHLPESEAVASRGSLNFQNTDATLRGADWQYLPGTEQEINELEKTLHKTGATVNIRKGYAATEESFKRLGQSFQGDKNPSPRILHIATHGFFFPDPKDNPQSAIRNPKSEEPVFKISDHPMIRSGLILAGANHAWKTGQPLRPDMEDGILTAYEISHLNLTNTKLVVLSACETGLGHIQGNEGVYGLQRAFKIAGAKYLIMSLWQVPDKETAEFMTTFYKKWLEEKMEIPEAFRAAQKEMRERGLDPYQWAGFVLVE